MTRLLNSALVFLAIVIGSVPSPALALALAQDEHKWEFTQQSGNQIAWSCTGQGEPTVMMIAGSGLDAHDSFGRIYHNYDGPGRVCMYDRAGLGKSTFPNLKTRTLDDLVRELRAVVEAANAKQLVLAPHSFGGFIARAYVAKYPAQVKGVLFIDVSHEDWLPNLKAGMTQADWAIFERILSWTESTYHEDYWQAQEAMRSLRFPPDLPITVLTRGIPHATIRRERLSDEGMNLYENEHRALQEKIAALSNNSQHRVARYSSHVFNDYDPWLVIEEIKALEKRLSN